MLIRPDHVAGRDSEFLHPALIEVADKAGLGADYLKCVDQLRSAASLIFDLIEVAHISTAQGDLAAAWLGPGSLCRAGLEIGR
jgi:hypothetical protein